MTSTRSGQGQTIKCGGLELDTVNAPLGLRGVTRRGEDKGGTGGMAPGGGGGLY